MPIIIPLRCVTAAAGLLFGYCVGNWIEKNEVRNFSLQRLLNAVTCAYSTSSMISELVDDMDDDCPELDFSSTEIDSDQDTEYSD